MLVGVSSHRGVRILELWVAIEEYECWKVWVAIEEYEYWSCG